MEDNIHRYFIRIRYKGSSYHGWQLQPNALSVQEVIDSSLSRLLRREIRSVGCGRTDAGVHANNFYLHFNFPGLFTIADCANLLYKLNRFLPDDISVLDIFRVKSDVHARYSAVSRTYNYIISRLKNPFNSTTSWYYPVTLDLELMQKSASRLMEYHDFAAFSKKDSDIIGTECQIMLSKWDVEEDLWIYTVKANRFLRNMVRALIGTQIKIGKGLLDIEDLDTIVESRNRCRAGESVPARGLSLLEVTYPDDIRVNF